MSALAKEIAEAVLNAWYDAPTPDASIDRTTAAADAAIAPLVEAVKAALDHYERNICHHDDTHRGGNIWTICDDCGRKWADDQGGFVPFEYPAEITAAFAILDRARVDNTPRPSRDEHIAEGCGDD